MKAFFLAAGLALATATTAAAVETFPDSGIAYGLSTGTATSQGLLSDCMSEDSSSRAIRACTKVLRAAGPDETIRAHILSRRGLHKMALGRFDDAATDFTRAGDLADHEGLATLGQGFAAMLDNDLMAARGHFEDCSNRGSVAPLAEYGLGLTYQMAGDTVKARQAYQRALDLRPGWDAVAVQMETLD
ncbi:tetratricopeptide repeat protein [Algimonas porphyrae]|uniref:Tetratricopeptide repeat protein n=1 Tax=Algimonas porphyrae TaxID=1128113 RepID=A0ABQ5V2H2_9PROT|nr:tetratricopeptide repeat protein [Algimonas porphyrae]GLQ21282.1 hypothetical protein GCM10007854_22370 [Algimonas porphyrae]